MIALVLALALVQTPAAPAAPTAPEAVAPEPTLTPAETLAGLEQVYSTTCGQTGILYHSYDELCDGLRKQITAYQKKIAQPAVKAPKS